MKVAGALLTTDDGKPVEFVRSPNQSAGLSPRFLIFHYTAGISAQSTIDWFKNRSASASAHLVIDRKGAITQMVGFDRRAWHAGESKWGQLNGMNRFSIGIELVNAGRLRRSESGEWFNWAGTRIPPEQVTVAQHRSESAPTGWHLYPEAQIAAALQAAVALHDAFSFEAVLGHDDVSPGRKIDPGPAFPLTSVSSRVFGRKN